MEAVISKNYTLIGYRQVGNNTLRVSSRAFRVSPPNHNHPCHNMSLGRLCFSSSPLLSYGWL